MKKISFYSMVTAALLSSPAFAADVLSDPVYYATALQDIPKNTALTRSNVTVASTKIVKQIPQSAVWLTSPAHIYGFRVREALHKGEPLSGTACYGHDSNNFTPAATDAQWVKFAKSAVVTCQRGDAKLGRRYRDGALAELDKMSARKEKIEYMDQESLISEMLLRYDDAVLKLSEQERIKRKTDLVWNMLPPEQRIVKIKQEQLLDAKNDYADSTKILKVLANVLPPESQQIGFSRANVKRAVEHLQDAQRN